MSAPLITAPGFYPDIPIDAYHGDEICPAPSISPTGIKRMLDCPRRYWHDSPLNPNRAKTETPALRFGSAIHDLLSDPDGFWPRVRVYDDFRKKADQEDAAAWKESGGIVLRTSERDNMVAMIDGLKADKIARLAFMGEGHIEATIAWQDEETGVWLRVRPDWLPAKRRFIPDYKTAASAQPEEFRRSIAKYGYHIAAAMIFDGCKAVFGDYPESFLFTPQEKTAPFIVSTVALDDSALSWGRVLARKGIRDFAECLNRDHWPAYTDDQPTTVRLPAWEESRLEAMVNDGTLELRAVSPTFERDFAA